MKKAVWLYSLWVSFICAVFFFFYSFTGLAIGWMSFIMLAVYFGTGSKLKDAPAILCSIIAGLIWGQLDFVFIGLMNSIGLYPAAGMFLGITVMTTVTMGLHLTVLGNTLFNRLPFIFTCVALTFSQGGKNEAGLGFTLVAGLILASVCGLGESFIFGYFKRKEECRNEVVETASN
jgi:hypothetical protein